ncbi:ketopantoate reductase family protein [Paremcibacter congregatus]|uniref:ketopantoate reductase family protein n=1 Tax=Paremcibacter congregatus TaxID=2043170 RepID=UPI003A8FB5EA
MRIAVMGTGGMGGFLGAKLAMAGHEVIFIARGPHLDAIKKNGLKLLSNAGDIHIHPATATEDTTEVGAVDLILFCVKLYDTTAAARACLPMMESDSFILTLQNGVESVDMLSSIVGQGRTIGGSIYVSASIESPGVITHSGGNNTIRFAEVDNQPSRRTEVLEDIFTQAGLVGIRAENLQVMLWSKFVLLSANAGVGALTDRSAAQMVADPLVKPLLLAAMQEAYDVASAMGIPLPEGVIDRVLDVIVSNGEKQDLIASQCLDLRKGRPLELEWIQGTLHRLGQHYDIPTPITSTCYAALKRFASGRQNP